MRPTSEVLHVLGPLLLATAFLVIVLVVYVLRNLRSSKVGDKVPIRLISDEPITIYKRDDGYLYQRIGPDLQVRVCRLRDGSIHMLGKPIPIVSMKELVLIVEMRERQTDTHWSVK